MEEEPISLVILDDHPIVLAGLQQLLATDSGFRVLTTCTTLEEGWAAIKQHDPDILLLDLKLSGASGLSLLKRLDPAKRPATVILTAAEEEHLLLEAVRLGARGVVLKATAPRVLDECLRAVAAGDRWLVVEDVDLSARLAHRQAIEADLFNVLTAREIEVMRLASAGLDNQQIADRLVIEVGTVKIHLHHIYGKLGLQGRADLGRFLAARGY
jgi:DNA-binding NarL/FixJ family response regulator